MEEMKGNRQHLRGITQSNPLQIRLCLPRILIVQAKRLFEAAIAANPSHAESLGNLAVLLHGQMPKGVKVLDRIEDLYRRAVRADPANANNVSNYGLFLAEVLTATRGSPEWNRRGTVKECHT